MQDIELLTRLYQLIELIGKESVFTLIDTACKAVEETIAEEDIKHDVDESKRIEETDSIY